MPTYIQSFEKGRWCVDHETRDVEPYEVVGFIHDWDAAHFVNQGRAGLIGSYATYEEAIAELERLVAENQKLRAQGAHDEPPPSEVNDLTKSEPPPSPAVPEGQSPKTGKAKKGR